MKETKIYVVIQISKLQTHILAGYTNREEALKVIGELALLNNEQLFFNKATYSLQEIMVHA